MRLLLSALFVHSQGNLVALLGTFFRSPIAILNFLRLLLLSKPLAAILWLSSTLRDADKYSLWVPLQAMVTNRRLDLLLGILNQSSAQVLRETL